jgi:hypothetical protein
MFSLTEGDCKGRALLIMTSMVPQRHKDFAAEVLEQHGVDASDINEETRARFL